MADIDWTKYNKACSDWVTSTVLKVKSKGKQMGVKHRQYSKSPYDSLAAVKGGTRRSGGVVKRCTFGFKKHMAYVHYGVGRGRGVGSGKEIPKPLFDVVTNELPKLVEAVQEAGMEIAIRGIFKAFLPK